MKGFTLCVVGLVLAGCQNAGSASSEPATAEPSSVTSSPPSSGSGVAPMATPVPNAPVTGTESLQGGGSAVGTVAKDRAKRAAAQASNPAGGSAPAEGE